MALLSSTAYLEPLIPEPNDEYYMSRITRVPDNVVNETPLYGIVVSGKEKKVIKVYKVAFVLISSVNSHFLMIGEVNKEISASTYFISTKIKDNEKLNIKHWNFKKDKIGLYVTTNNYQSDTIYFATSPLDVSYIKQELEKEENNKTVVTEVVYV